MYGQLGRIEEAGWEAEDILSMRPNFRISNHALFVSSPTLQARFVEGLRKAGLPE